MPPKRKTATKTAVEAEEPAVEQTTPVPEEVAVELAMQEEEAPAIVVSGTPTEMYAQLQVVVARDAAKINEYVAPLLELMHAAEDPASPILLRVRFLEFIGKNVANLRDNNALKKIVTSLVKIIGAEDNTPQLLIAALQCFPGLGPVSMLDKRWEYLSREGADILMQVIIDREAFADAVRSAARKALDALTDSAFRSVVTKLVHWLSDDREDDEAEQIRRERHLALSTLTRLTLAPSMRQHWTEETQQFVLSLIYRVLAIVDARELGQLARVAAHLPIVHAKHGVPLLESFLAENKLDSERNVEAVAILSRFVFAAAPKKGEAAAEPLVFDLVTPLEQAGLLTVGSIDGESRKGMLLARVVLLAARLAPEAAVEKLVPFVTGSLLALVGSDGAFLPENLATLETLLFATVAVAAKKPTAMLQLLGDEAFNAALTAISTAAAALEPELVFAVKKKMRGNTADAEDAEAIACVHNIQTVTAAFAAKHVPMSEVKESWIGKAKLPAMKRGRDQNAGGLPPAPGTAAANDRSHHNDGNRSNNRSGRSNNGSSNSNDRKRSQSSSHQPHKSQRTSSNRGGPRRRF